MVSPLPPLPWFPGSFWPILFLMVSPLPPLPLSKKFKSSRSFVRTRSSFFPFPWFLGSLPPIPSKMVSPLPPLPWFPGSFWPILFLMVSPLPPLPLSKKFKSSRSKRLWSNSLYIMGRELNMLRFHCITKKKHINLRSTYRNWEVSLGCSN